MPMSLTTREQLGGLQASPKMTPSSALINLMESTGLATSLALSL